MRLIVYVDSVYRRVDGAVFGELSFTEFLVALARTGEIEVTIIGRLDPAPGPAYYRIPEHVRFVPLPHYRSLADPRRVLSSLLGSLRPFWRALSEADTVLLFGPYLQSQIYALLAVLRGRKVVLGVRQDFPTYIRHRRPGSRTMHLAADALELGWRLLSRRLPTVVVGPQLAERYRKAPRLLEIAVSLISGEDVRAGEHAAAERSYSGQLELLSVGRLDEEKNPLLLADVLAALRARDGRWRLSVCGDGPLREPLERRLSELGLEGSAAILGHVDFQRGLLDLYRSSHVFLHVSRTEGFPQVLMEAFASGVPVVATAVGGVPAAVDGAALLVAPDQPQPAAAAAESIAADPDLRGALVRAGLERAGSMTLERVIGEVREFISR